MQRIVSWASLAVLLLHWVVVFWFFHRGAPIPALIPIHFNAAGRADHFGPAASLWQLPSVALGLFVLMTGLLWFAGVFCKPADQNKLQRYSRMITWLIFEVQVIFLWIMATSVAMAQNPSSSARGLSILFLPLTFGAVVVTIGWYIYADLRRSLNNILQ